MWVQSILVVSNDWQISENDLYLYVLGFVAVRKRGEERQRNVDGTQVPAEKVTTGARMKTPD